MVFKLPTTLCKRLYIIISNYLWSHNGRRAIHWANKFLMSRSKEMGGMNFRDFELMNDAFLLKQFWRILERPTSLVSRCLKAKYFLNTSIFDAHLWNNYSSVWKGIWKVGVEARDLLVVNNDNSVVWKGDQNDLFSIKSAYRCLKKRKDDVVLAKKGEISDSSYGTQFWKIVWRSSVQEKVKKSLLGALSIIFFLLLQTFVPVVARQMITAGSVFPKWNSRPCFSKMLVGISLLKFYGLSSFIQNILCWWCGRLALVFGSKTTS